jgi:Arm DNA-binding domain
MPAKLTQKLIAGLVCPPGKRDQLVFDTEAKGLAVRVTAKGGKTFLAQYAVPSGKRRMPLGAFGSITLEQARQAARVILGERAKGRDPAAERKAEAEAARRAPG